MKKIVAVAIAVVFAVTIVGSGAWPFPNSGTTDSGTSEPITIGNAQSLECDTLTYIAEDQNFFAQNGLNVTIRDYTSGMEAVNALFNGSVDIAATAEFPLVKAALNQEKVSAIVSIDKSLLQDIIGRKDRGIENISDFKGKRIGVTLGTIAQFYLGRFLTLHGVNLQDVTIVNISPSESVDAITKGAVDAIIIWQPYANIIENALDDNAAIWPVQSSQTTYIVEVAKNDWIAQHPDIVRRYVNALAQAEDYFVQHPDQTKSMMQKKLNYTDAYMEAVWDKNQFSLSLDQSLVTAMEDEGRWMIRNNLTSEKTIPNFRKYIYTKGMQEIKPEAVNIIG
ncbi:MAG: ABC transporter substrate-binding protein [Syntrophales bacterium]